MLPSERKFAVQLDVSRVPVREALKVLEYLGIVQHVRGKGVFVKQADPAELFPLLGPMLSATPGMIADLFEVRLLIEPHASYLAALNNTPDDLAKIEGTLRAMEAAIQYKLDIGPCLV